MKLILAGGSHALDHCSWLGRGPNRSGGEVGGNFSYTAGVL